MGTTMAPMDQLRRNTLEERLERQHLASDPIIRRREDNGDTTSLRRGEGRRDNGDNNANGNNGGDGQNDDGGNGGNNQQKKANDDSNPQKPPKSSPQPNAQGPPPPPPSKSPLAFPSTIPDDPKQVSTPNAFSIAAEPTSTTPFTNTLISTFPSIAPTAAPFQIVGPSAFGNGPNPSSQEGRKGLSEPPEFSTSQPTMTSSMFGIPQGLASPTPMFDRPPAFLEHKHNPNNLAPTAQHLLIAAGTIGAFVIVVAALYFLTKVRKIDLMGFFRGRKFESGGTQGWYGWRQQADYTSDPPPQYSGEPYVSDKNIPVQGQVELVNNSSPVSLVPYPAATAIILDRSSPEAQETTTSSLLATSVPFAKTPAPETSATANFYGFSTQQPAPEISATANFYGFSTQQPTSITREPGTQSSQNTAVSRPNTNYNNTGTQNTFMTFQTQATYDPAQSEPNHLSYLSSLSSGFGDGLIIPEPTVGRQSYRQSKAPGAGRFSWMTNTRASTPYGGDRDTVYTTVSIETAPRFRTVNSWVAQQAGRLQRQQSVDENVSSMPPVPDMPAPLQFQLPENGVEHRRMTSEDPMFRQHPGEEINISMGSRIASSILDKKFSGN